jgi:hypothetical protein
MPPAGGIEIALRLALEEVADPAIEMDDLSGNAQQPAAMLVGLGPHRAALAPPMHDPMHHATQRQLGGMRERHRLGHSLEARGNPGTVLLGEFLRLPHAAARGHGEHHLARGGVDAQGVAARLAMASHADEIDRPLEHDLHDRRLARTPIQQRTQRHGRDPTVWKPGAKYCHNSKRPQQDRQEINPFPNS